MAAVRGRVMFLWEGAPHFHSQLQRNFFLLSHSNGDGLNGKMSVF